MNNHSFVVPAYGRSPHLTSCLASLQRQDRPSQVILSTSTPFEGIERLAVAHGAQLVVHGPNRGIGADWNAAINAARTPWVTIAHQDDIYLPQFSSEVARVAARHPDASLLVTDYRELVGDAPQKPSGLLKVKKLLLELGFAGRHSVTSCGAKRRLLRFGCPLPCPAVTLGPAATGLAFREDLKVNLDWDAWLRLAGQPGRFCYVRKPLMLHRIHLGSETTTGIRTGIRAAEDMQMFTRIWPPGIARLLAGLYSLSYRFSA